VARIGPTDRLKLVEGDITELDVSAVVNPANSALQLGSGVAGAIRARGGPAIQAECDRIGRCPVGGAVVTGAGDLKARHVIHAVGPLGSEAQADEKLASACRAALERAAELKIDSIAIPAISTGVFGFPIDRAARILVETAADFAASHEKPARIFFCLRGEEALREFQRALETLARQRRN
jgi:O-acetyl-ADP-ribose deacetylase (regulator of RNase III)